VFLKVSPIKGVMQFGKKGKLSPQYVSTYSVLRRVGNVVYDLELPYSLSSILPVFYVCILRKCMSNPSQIVLIKDIGISDSLFYEEVLVEIFDRQLCWLRTKDMALVRV